MGKKTKRLHYLNSSVHRIVDGMCIQGGDITVGDGTGVLILKKLTFREHPYTEDHLLMKISKEDMLVQVSFQWQTKVEILILHSSLLH
jgi:cyclophilin family peptidyl-prolyl cis-trans isomerase